VVGLPSGLRGVDGFVRNRWTDCPGFSGRFRPESVDGLKRNQWSGSVGIRTTGSRTGRRPSARAETFLRASGSGVFTWGDCSQGVRVASSLHRTTSLEAVRTRLREARASRPERGVSPLPWPRCPASRRARPPTSRRWATATTRASGWRSITLSPSSAPTEAGPVRTGP